MSPFPGSHDVVFEAPDDPIERIQEELQASGAADVRVKVSLVASGRPKVYLGMLPPLDVGQVGEVAELVAHTFGGSSDGHFHLEFRVGGRFAGNATLSVAGDPFPVRRSPPSVTHASPFNLGGQPSAPPVVPEVEQKLRRALKRRRLENESLARRLEDLERRQLVPHLAPTNPVDDAIKLMKTKPPEDPALAALQAQISEAKKLLDAEREERQKERERQSAREARHLRKSLRILRRKFERLESGEGEQVEDPLTELLHWKLKIEKARAAGVDGSFLDRLTKMLDTKLGDKLLTFIEAQATNVLQPNVGATTSSSGAAGKGGEDSVAFAKFLQAQLLKGFTFVTDKAEVLGAVEKWPALMGKLASLTAREQLVDFCVELGFPRPITEKAFPEDKSAACLGLIEELRKTLAAIAEDAKTSAPPPSGNGNGAAKPEAKEGVK